MRLLSWRWFPVGLFLTVGLTSMANADPSVVEHAGRGVFDFVSTSGCPLKARTPGDTNCHRLALADTDTHAVVDTSARTIDFTNTRAYERKTEVGDVLLHGSGIAADGQRVPLSLHLHLSRDGQAWKTSMHSHAPVPGTFTDIRIDPYRITVNGHEARDTVLTPEQGAGVLVNPTLAARLANEFVQVDSNASAAGIADITISLGLPKVAKPVMRARFQQGDPHAVLPGDNGTWSLELQALSSHIPRKVTRRDLFLFGLENEKLLHRLREKSFDKRDVLTIGMRDGKGYLRLNDAQEDFPGAAQTARAFLEDSFIGLILARQYRTARP